jgi:catechol 2,3-dioxygenase-like lactoylglutathione lyase family enzyme
MSMIQALGNVSKVRGALIFVENAEEELSFYRDIIGLRLLYRTKTFLRFDATQGTSLSLISGGHASAEPKDYRQGGVVPELIVDNLALAIRRLDAAGVRHEQVVRTEYGSFCFLWDPEGNPLQFYESAFIRPDADPERQPG